MPKLVIILLFIYLLGINSVSAEKITMAPLGHIVLCMKQPNTVACKSRGASSSFRLTRTRLGQLVSINRRINKTVRQKRDGKSAGVDIWSVAKRSGDCEDFALRKQYELVKLGWPTSLLRIAVTTYRGQGHAVLIAGDKYVLDNLNNKLQRVGHYRIKKRQSKVDPQKWVRG